MRRLVPIVALVAALGAAYWFDGILPDIRKAVGITFDPVPGVWTETIAKFVAGIAVAGLGWLLFEWSPPSRLAGLVFTLVGGLLLFFWPLTLSLHMSLPSAFFGLYLRLSVDGVLNLVAPFVTAVGLVRLIWPLPTSRARSSAVQP
jgi:hypothetical protein